MGDNLNPAANTFVPANGNQVSPPSYTELLYKVEDLEREQACSRAEVSDLKTLCHTLQTEINALKKGGWTVTVGPFREQSISNARFAKALGALKQGATGPVLPQDLQYSSQDSANNASSSNVLIPPHRRYKAGNASVAKAPTSPNGNAGKTPVSTQAVGSGASNRLVTDGIVDDPDALALRKAAQREPTPPLSPKTIETQVSAGIEHLSLDSDNGEIFKPFFIRNLPVLPQATLSQIPPEGQIVSFSGDFLRNHLGGVTWSPGLVFVPPPEVTMLLPNRAYYTVDPAQDPHLPAAPGQHGAKMVPFFNEAPEDNSEFTLPVDLDTSSNVPLFVLRSVPGPDGTSRKRYIYYGHYTQSRWSDKLDYDHMLKCVPTAVREHWAEYLSASGRPEWVSEALQKHFFPLPAYTGSLPPVLDDEGGSVPEEEMAAREEKTARDVKRHVEKLRMYKKEHDMRASLIHKDFILSAFDQADADEQKALRLWWEYLECVDWRADFYKTLVTLQSRNPNYA